MSDLDAAGRELAHDADRLAEAARDLAERARELAARTPPDAADLPAHVQPGTGAAALLVIVLAVFLGRAFAHGQAGPRLMAMASAATGAVVIGAFIAAGSAEGAFGRGFGFVAVTLATAMAVIGVGLLLRGPDDAAPPGDMPPPSDGPEYRS